MTRVPPMICKPHRVPECLQCKKGTTMAGKCEHGLTTRECMVCASPKYGAETGDKWVTIPRARLAELEASEAEVLLYRDQAHRSVNDLDFGA